MMNPKITTYYTETGVIEEREMTPEEIADLPEPLREEQGQ
jgi:hypothetical protein